VLDLAATTAISQDRLEAWRATISKAIPRIFESLAMLDSTVRSSNQTTNNMQQASESQIEDDLGK
jgi:hypothetical protein